MLAGPADQVRPGGVPGAGPRVQQGAARSQRQTAPCAALLLQSPTLR